jgi:hypothetical protein
MKLSFNSKGDFNATTDWLNRMSNADLSTALTPIANQGKAALAAGTPKATGETASGWQARVVRKGASIEIEWFNTAHPEAGVNLAKLIELGHGTGTGGYVPPKPYIKQAMTPVWASLDSKLKELIK